MAGARPSVDGRIDDGTVVVRLAMAGVDPKDVEVSWMDDVLTVKGERAPGGTDV